MRVVSVGECMVEFARRDDGLWRQGFAGDTLNVAWALRALLPPADDVDYLTRIGRDALSDAMLSMVEAGGIGTAHIGRDDERTIGLYTIATDPDGERHFSYWRSASAARGLAADPAFLDAGLAGADLVYLSGITLAILPPPDRARLLARLGRPGGRSFRVAFDPNIRPRLWETAEAIRHGIEAAAIASDIILPTFDDEARIFGDASAEETLDRYGRLGVGEIVVKDGTRPTLAMVGGIRFERPVRPNRDVIDTTGAGDSFNGGYLASRLTGAGPEHALAVAQAVSAMVVGRRGALAPQDEIARIAASAV